MYKLQLLDKLKDGGGTFLPIAKQLTEKGAIVYLYVTHGIFSKGIDIFEDFEKIFTTDSVTSLYKDTEAYKQKVIII